MFLFIKNIVDYICLKISFRKINKLPINEQLKFAKQAYNLIYKNIEVDKGDYKAISSVIFTCKYPGHVAAIRRFINNKLQEDNYISYLDFKEVGLNRYILSVGVSISDPNKPAILTNTYCMLFLSQVNSIEDDFVLISADLDKDIDFQMITDAFEETLKKEGC